MWYFMFGQVALRSVQVDFGSTGPVGQVGFSVNVEPWFISNLFHKQLIKYITIINMILNYYKELY